jgi:outer membrane protein assembly factor BamB
MPGQTLFSGQSISSSNGQYLLVLQSDGNLVYYKYATGGVRWHSQTTDGTRAFMQTDGNFVVYNQAFVPRWDAKTGGKPGAYLAAQDDGNLVIYGSDGTVLWNIGADLPSSPQPQPVYPMIKNKPNNVNPPSGFPSSNFLNCTTNGCV